MKTRFLKLSAFTVVVIAALSLGVFFSCEEKDDNNGKTNNPIINTEWKLIEFVDVANNTTKIPEPSDSICYRLEFEENLNKLNVHSSTNSLSGEYIINTENYSLLIKNLYGTEINEVYDGNLFMQGIKNTRYYSVSNNILELYYNNRQNYLKFERK